MYFIGPVRKFFSLHLICPLLPLGQPVTSSEQAEACELHFQIQMADFHMLISHKQLLNVKCFVLIFLPIEVTEALNIFTRPVYLNQDTCIIFYFIFCSFILIYCVFFWSRKVYFMLSSHYKQAKIITYMIDYSSNWLILSVVTL